jgi:hypothetical protein
MARRVVVFDLRLVAVGVAATRRRCLGVAVTVKRGRWLRLGGVAPQRLRGARTGSRASGR